MSDISYVYTRKELKQAINNKSAIVAIKDQKLARNVRIVKAASRASVAVAITMILGSALAPIASPVVVTFSAASAATGAATGTSSLIWAVVFLIVVLGASALWAIYKDYSIYNEFETEILGQKVKAKMVLVRNK